MQSVWLESKPAQEQEKSLRILLLEDDSNDAELILLALERGALRHVAKTVGNQDDFLRQLEEFKPDLILSDYQLPGFSGVVALQLARKRFPDLPFILITGALGDELAVQTIKEGATDYILKDRLFQLTPAILRAVRESKERLSRRQAEARFRTLLEAAPDAMVIINESQRIVLINSQAEKMFGYTGEELLGESLGRLVPPQLHGRPQPIHSASLNSGHPRVEGNCDLYGLRKDGSEFCVEISFTPFTLEQEILQTAVIRDITQRKEAETRLRESEERFRQLAENIQQVFWMTDLTKQEMLYISPGYETIWGRTCASLYASPLNWLEAIHPEDRERVRQAALTKQTSGEYHVEYRITRPDGSIRWIQDRAFPISNDLGEVYRVVGIAEDVTRWKQAQEQIRLLADAVESTQELVSITDADNRFTFVNRAFLQAYGYSQTEVLGQRPDMLRSPQNPPGLEEKIFHETRRGGWRGELLNRRKDGSEFPIYLSTSQIRDGQGQLIGLIGMARDISELKRAEKNTAALALTGHRLNAATVPRQAAEVILSVAGELFGWHSGSVDLCSLSEGALVPILRARRQAAPAQDTAQIMNVDADSLLRTVKEKGAQLVYSGEEGLETEPAGAGASMMYVPIRSGETILGVACIQKRHGREGGYSEENLILFQALADYCGYALERIRVTEALRVAEAKYRNIFENAAEGIFQTSIEDRFISANPALARMLGYDSPEALLSSVKDIGRQTYVHPEQRAELRRLLELQEVVTGFEVERLRKDGSTFWMSINGRVVRDAEGKTVWFEGLGQDITARKQAEAVLRESERKLRLIAENTIDVIFAFDMERRPVYANPAVERLTGYTFAELQEQGFINWIHPDDQERMLKHWEELFVGKGYSDVEFRLVTKRGEIKWCSSTWGPIYDETGRQVGVQGCERDVTRRKQLELEVLESSTNERRRVGHELHDGLGQYLAGIALRAKALEQTLISAGTAHAPDAVELTRLISRAVAQTRNLARGLDPVEIESSGVVAALQNVASEAHELFRVTCLVRCSEPTLRMVPQAGLAAYRIAQEAIHNAITHGEAKRIEIDLSLGADQICLKIRDDGSGFDPKNKTGAGMGLRVMEYRARSVNGRLNIDSVPGSGTEISCLFPLTCLAQRRPAKRVQA